MLSSIVEYVLAGNSGGRDHVFRGRLGHRIDHPHGSYCNVKRNKRGRRAHLGHDGLEALLLGLPRWRDLIAPHRHELRPTDEREPFRCTTQAHFVEDSFDLPWDGAAHEFPDDADFLDD